MKNNNEESSLRSGMSGNDGEPQSGEELEERRHESVSFKKAFNGYNPQEVMQYVDAQDEIYRSSCSMYERTIDGLKSEIALLRSENEAQKEQLEVANAALNAANARIAELEAAPVQAEPEPAPEPEPEPEPEEPQEDPQVERLRGEIKDQADEIMKLQEQLISAQNEIDRLGDVEKTSQELQTQIDRLKEVISEKSQSLNDDTVEIARLNTEITEARAKLAENEKLKFTLADITEQLKAAKAELEAKSTALDAMTSDLDRLKRSSGDMEVRVKVISEQADKLMSENASLKELNRQQAYDFTDSKRAIEAEAAVAKAKYEQQLQIYTYHIGQIRLLLDQLNTQFDKASGAVAAQDTSDSSGD